MKKLRLMTLLGVLLCTSCGKDKLIGSAPEHQPVEYSGFMSPSHFYGVAPTENGTKGTAQRDNLWYVGTTIKVKILNDPYSMSEKVQQWAKEWEQYANITFQFVEEGDAHVRVGFDWNENRWITWSYIGTDCKMNTDQNDATMSFAFWDYATQEEMRGDVLRAFGQALGLELEHRHLDFTPGWRSEERIKQYWEGELWDIPWEQIEKYVYTALDRANTIQTDDYDPESIMIWPFASSYATNTQRSFNYELSQTDKAFIAEVYPEEQETEEAGLRMLTTVRIYDDPHLYTVRLSTQKDIDIDWGDGTRETFRAPMENVLVSHVFPDDDVYDIHFYGVPSAILSFNADTGNGSTGYLYLYENKALHTLVYNGRGIIEGTGYELNALSHLPALEHFSSTQSLSGSGEWLSFEGNPLLRTVIVPAGFPSMDFTHNPLLQTLICGGTSGPINLTACPLLQTLNVTDSRITTLDLSGNPSLTALNLTSNPQLTELDLSHQTQLSYFSIASTGITTIDLSPCTQLNSVDISDTRIASIDLTACSLLHHLTADDCPALKEVLLDCPEFLGILMKRSGLESVDFTKCPRLIYVYAEESLLRELDLTGLPVQFINLQQTPMVEDRQAMIRMAESLPDYSATGTVAEVRFSNYTEVVEWIGEICTSKGWNYGF